MNGFDSTSTGGLVVQGNGSSITYSYWDTQTTGQATSGGSGATGLTTAQMKATSGTYPSDLGSCFQFNFNKYPKIYTWDAVTSACNTNMLLGGSNATR